MCCFDFTESNKFDLFLVAKIHESIGHHDMLLKDQGKL